MAQVTGSTGAGGAREYHEPQVRQQELTDITTEAMAAHSPDGRVPDQETRVRGRKTFWIVLLIGIPLVMGTLIYLGGMPALLMAGVYVALFAVAAFPAWYSGFMRKREEDEATEIVRHTLAEVHGKERTA
jgi:hypothetical protein